MTMGLTVEMGGKAQESPAPEINAVQETAEKELKTDKKKVIMGFTFVVYEDKVFDFPQATGVNNIMELLALVKVAENAALQTTVKEIVQGVG